MDLPRRLKHIRMWFWIIAGITIASMLTLTFYYPDYYQAEVEAKPLPEEFGQATIRLPGKDPVEMAIAVAQNIYPATFADNKPGAIILVPVEDWRAAVLATEIIHFPINAPILYTKKGELTKETLDEIKRLDPEGLFVDNNVKVILIGDVGKKTKEQLKKEKLKFRELEAESTEALASLLDDYKAMIHVDHDDEVLIVPLENPAFAILPASWVAHAGHSIFFVSKDGLAQETRNSLAKRPQDAFMYVLGNEEAIPQNVIEELANFGHVQRIPGKDPYEMSTGFAGYKDFGRNFGWWIRRTTREFGWGIAEAGHNFTIINPDYPEMAIPAAALSHMGKHGPFLLVKSNQVPEPIIRYLKIVQPTFLSSQEQLFNHGWIIGDQEIIGSSVLYELDKLLQLR
ncbi:MAG: cell wall-binding repeat-containing protein [Bacillota bacterium]|nr:cell wall-binding repeat-containing protein [Bacillota bacterium]